MRHDFQTPPWLCREMVSMLPSGVATVLEPTPGRGNLVRALKEAKYLVTAPEEFWSVSGRFDAVVMNPPFTPMETGYDIFFRCLEMSDIVIAIMPWLTLINSQERTRRVEEFGLKSVLHLPRRTFPGTRVQACLLELVKGTKPPARLTLTVSPAAYRKGNAGYRVPMVES